MKALVQVLILLVAALAAKAFHNDPHSPANPPERPMPRRKLRSVLAELAEAQRRNLTAPATQETLTQSVPKT